jgi:hypothetical protein
MWILNTSQPYRPPQPVTGIAFFYFWIKYAFGGKRCIDRISVHIYTNMDGSKKIPLLLTGKLEKPRCSKHVKSLKYIWEHNCT